MPLLLDVLEIFARTALRRVALTHVAEPAREFRQALAIRRFAHPLHGHMSRLDELRTGKHRHGGLQKNGAIGERHRVRSKSECARAGKHSAKR